MRRRLAAVAAAAFLALPLSVVGMNLAFAETLFGDTFDDGNADGWSKSGGSWSVAGGAYRQSSTGASAKALAGNTSWTDYTVSARVTPTAFGASGRSVGVAARVQTSTNYYALVLTGGG